MASSAVKHVQVEGLVSTFYRFAERYTMTMCNPTFIRIRFTGVDENRQTLSRRMCQQRGHRPRSASGFGRRRLSGNHQLFRISEELGRTG